MERKTGATGFGEILDAADRLSLEEQEALIELLSPRAADRKHDQSGREIRNARKEFKEGRTKPSTPEDILSEILS